MRKTACLVLLIAMVALSLSLTACCGDKEILTAGPVTFTLQVVDGDGNQTDFAITTEEATVGEALADYSLIVGEDGPYGLYVKQVNGITADYDVDGTYWAFYVNGVYAVTGVDKTVPEEGAVYTFKVEK